MGNHYENFVKEVLATAQHQIRYPETNKRIKLFIRNKNMASILDELKRQCGILWPELKVEHVGDIEQYFRDRGVHIEIMHQVKLTDDYKYVRYEVDQHTIIFADYDQ
jgi:hypothetical protein